MYGQLGVASHTAALEAQLEDAQASLAAALARIEAFRIREKAIISENASLRIELNKKVPGCVVLGPPPEPLTDSSPTSCGPASTALSTERQTSEKPSVAEIIPINLLSAGRKVACSVILHKESVDFVEHRVRIRQQDYVCMTTVKEPAVMQGADAPNGRSPRCFACLGGDARPGKGPRRRSAAGICTTRTSVQCTVFNLRLIAPSKIAAAEPPSCFALQTSWMRRAPPTPRARALP